MLILAVDTALEACSVGIDRPGEPPIFRSEVIGRGHGERLFGMVREAMAEAGIGFDAVGRFAVTVGPGSFAGVRIGVAAVRGFALVTGKPAVGVTTLAVCAEAARALSPGRPVLAILDARHGAFYAQLFDAAGAALTAPAVESRDALVALARDHSAVLAGPGAPQIGTTDEGLAHAPDMAALLRLARAAKTPAEPPRPLYLRPPDAVVSPNAALPRRA